MKRAQVSVFVIFAIVIIAVVVVIFVFRTGIGDDAGVSAAVAPVFDFYLDCIEQETRLALEVAGTQGGWIDSGTYIPGSEYAPFSSHLNFLGAPVPYWYFLSGNGVLRENVPSVFEIERELADFIAEGIEICDFEPFSQTGFTLSVDEPEVVVSLDRDHIDVTVVSDLSVRKNEVSGRKRAHEVRVASRFGKLYESALEIYQFQKEDAVFEQYALDVLRLNAPVDGVELQCGPKVWATQEIDEAVRGGLEENLRTLKFRGDYYELTGEDRDYFEIDQPVDEEVRVLYFAEWPTRLEIDGGGVEDDFLIADPIGTQEGLGALGFCYVPYHYVYDLSFPVLVQVSDGDELFQFPMTVIIENNLPRLGNFGSVPLSEPEDFDLCEFTSEEVRLSLFDFGLNPVDANVSFECFDQECRLGESRDGILVARAPACVNGYLVVTREGFADKRELFSSNRESFKEILLEREFRVAPDVLLDGSEFSGSAIVTFVRDDGYTRSVALPEVSAVDLTEGSYIISAYVYGNASLSIPASTRLECVDVPRSGLLGFFGGSEEECFEITTPASEVDFALVGGGTLDTYLFDSDLASGRMQIRASRLPEPDSLEDLAGNFEVFQTRRLEIVFE